MSDEDEYGGPIDRFVAVEQQDEVEIWTYEDGSISLYQKNSITRGQFIFVKGAFLDGLIDTLVSVRDQLRGARS